MVADRPSRDELESIVKEAIAALAGVDSATLNETSELGLIFENRPVANRYLAETLEPVLSYRGGAALTASEVAQALTIREIVEKILEKWR